MEKPKHSHGPTHWDEVLKREFEDESDRACVILAAALLDSALETLLKTYFVSSYTSDDPLFDSGNAPLSSFSAKIEIAHRIGLIDAGYARSLHLVRKIRNDFAHNITGCTFSDSVVASRLTELRRNTELPEKEPEARKCFPDGPRGDFQMVVSWMQWMLRALIEHVDPIRHKFLLEVAYGTFFDKDKEKEKSSEPPKQTS